MMLVVVPNDADQQLAYVLRHARGGLVPNHVLRRTTGAVGAADADLVTACDSLSECHQNNGDSSDLCHGTT